MEKQGIGEGGRDEWKGKERGKGGVVGWKGKEKE